MGGGIGAGDGTLSLLEPSLPFCIGNLHTVLLRKVLI
jgi:hypothetical protein